MNVSEVFFHRFNNSWFKCGHYLLVTEQTIPFFEKLNEISFFPMECNERHNKVTSHLGYLISMFFSLVR